MTFYRVILDEAHMIKNHMSRTSIACRALIGKLRWVISGTVSRLPTLTTNLTDFYFKSLFLSNFHSGFYGDKVHITNQIDQSRSRALSILLIFRG